MDSPGKKLNVLQITPFFPPGFAFGGPAFASAALASGLRNLGHQVITLTSDRNGDGYISEVDRIKESVGDSTIFCSTLKGRWLFSWELIGKIYKYITSADVVMLTGGNWNYFFLVGCRISRTYGCPYVVYPHGNLVPYALTKKRWKKRIWWHLFDKESFQNAATVVTLTQAETEELRKLGITSRIEIIPNGINLEGFEDALSREEIEFRFPELRNKRWLLFMGRLHPIKGLDLLLPAIALVRRRHPEVTLVLAGPDEGGYSQTVRQMIMDLGLDNAVHITGMVTGALKHGLLRHSELFALTSHNECLPVGVLEAMACGLPVVITPRCNIPEVAEHEAGIIVNPDPQEIAAAIVMILENEKMRREMKFRAAALVQRNFNSKRVMEQTSELLIELAGKKVDISAQNERN